LRAVILHSCVIKLNYPKECTIVVAPNINFFVFCKTLFVFIWFGFVVWQFFNMLIKRPVLSTKLWAYDSFIVKALKRANGRINFTQKIHQIKRNTVFVHLKCIGLLIFLKIKFCISTIKNHRYYKIKEICNVKNDCYRQIVWKKQRSITYCLSAKNYWASKNSIIKTICSSILSCLFHSAFYLKISYLLHFMTKPEGWALELPLIFCFTI